MLKDRDISPYLLSQMMRVPKQTVYKIINEGNIEKSNYRLLRSMADALNIDSVDALIRHAKTELPVPAETIAYFPGSHLTLAESTENELLLKWDESIYNLSTINDYGNSESISTVFAVVNEVPNSDDYDELEWFTFWLTIYDRIGKEKITLIMNDIDPDVLNTKSLNDLESDKADKRLAQAMKLLCKEKEPLLPPDKKELLRMKEEYDREIEELLEETNQQQEEETQ